ncbi:DoxX family protein [Marinigracilibium pacificum]|uniref:DoxX family membrane protein n=1 Tax=Marinigracilibium pacificum TaxID=2729599 RepID=A0A848J1Z2_9BACT|nr:hypothetical protein [Marinigracilibium pacificum]NMM50843.1 hypothetical protein [Marinigracilibium pacificum]
MKPFILLIITFVISAFLTKVFTKEFSFSLAARIAMAIMLVFTAIGHFVFTKGMTMMIPEFIPFKESIVYLTGIFEILIAIGLLIPGLKLITGWVLIIFLILILPANIYASMNNINYQTGAFDGYGLAYLWFRIPLQLFFIVWTYISAIRF